TAGTAGTANFANNADKLDGRDSTDFVGARQPFVGDVIGVFNALQIAPGVIQVPDLGFDVATQAELNAAIASVGAANPAAEAAQDQRVADLEARVAALELQVARLTAMVFGGGGPAPRP